MMDDPRQILADAGVECAEVDNAGYWMQEAEEGRAACTGSDRYLELKAYKAALLALARLVAKYKWLFEYVSEQFATYLDDHEGPTLTDDVVFEAEDRWEERAS
jgi:hypothetical protein